MLTGWQLNVIMENLFSQVNENGQHFHIVHEIVEHQKDGSAIPI